MNCDCGHRLRPGPGPRLPNQALACPARDLAYPTLPYTETKAKFGVSWRACCCRVVLVRGGPSTMVPASSRPQSECSRLLPRALTCSPRSIPSPCRHPVDTAVLPPPGLTRLEARSSLPTAPEHRTCLTAGLTQQAVSSAWDVLEDTLVFSCPLWHPYVSILAPRTWSISNQDLPLQIPAPPSGRPARLAPSLRAGPTPPGRLRACHELVR